MRITPEELSLVRSRPQRTKLSLSIYRPTTALQCMVTGSISRNEITIPYYNSTTGDYTGVEEGMTLLVGSTLGGRELGTVRIRSITSSEITVAENSYIEWKNDLHLTAQRQWGIWPVYPRIIPDPADAEDTIWYKDYDILYTNQNTILGAFPCAGPHRATYLESNGTGTMYYTATGTVHATEDSFSTHWWFEGGNPSGSNAETPGEIAYNAAGHYATRLIVSGSAGSVDTSYRYASIYDRPENGTNNPILKWELSSIEGSPSGGGYTASIRVLENIDLYDGDVVVLFGESWFGNNKQTIGGNASGNSDIFFVGHVLSGSIRYNYKFGETTFRIGNISAYLKEQEGFSVSVSSNATPSDWYELAGLNMTKALYHYLRWHTTVLLSNDVQFLGDDRPVQYFDSDRRSAYDALHDFLHGAMRGRAVTDMQGKLWLEAGAQAFPLAASQTYSTPLFEMQKGDWIDTPNIEEIFKPDVSYLEYGGIAFSGDTTGTFAPFMADAPGSTPLYRGKAERLQGLALKSQTELNSMVGHELANRNYTYPKQDYNLVAAFRNLDIAPQESVVLLVDAADTPRGVAISGTYLPDSISWKYDSKKQSFNPSNISFVPLVTGAAGQTIDIPDTPDDAGFTNPPPSSPSVPALTYPALFAGAIPDTVLSYLEIAQPSAQTLSPAFSTDFPWAASYNQKGTSIIWPYLTDVTKIRIAAIGFYTISYQFEVGDVDSQAVGAAFHFGLLPSNGTGIMGRFISDTSTNIAYINTSYTFYAPTAQTGRMRFDGSAEEVDDSITAKGNIQIAYWGT